MTIKEARDILRKILAAISTGDFEKAHALEDGLHTAALQTIAKDNLCKHEAKEMAQVALASTEWGFPRWDA